MKKDLVKLIIIFVIGVLVGLVIGWCWPQQFKAIDQFKENLSVNAPDKVIGEIVNNLQGQVSAVKKQGLEFTVKQLSDRQVVSVTKTAQINSGTVIYLLTPKTADSSQDEYLKQLTVLRNKLKEAVQAKDTKKLATLKEELKTLTLARGAERDKQASELNAKINSLPADSMEFQEAQRAYLELTSTFKYSIITLADIASGDNIQAWSQDDLTGKDNFIATKIEIKR